MDGSSQGRRRVLGLDEVLTIVVIEIAHFATAAPFFTPWRDRGPPHPGRLGLPTRVRIATVQNNYTNYQVVHRVAAIGLHFNLDCTSVSFATVRVLEAPSARGIVGKHIQEATMKSRKGIVHGA
jgi:hypothetical protein